ncbi:MAG: TonB-dependent receptor, partial [Sphingobacteriales bacterium]
MQKTFLLLLMLAAGYAKAQQNISLHLQNDKGQPAAGASIELRKFADSVLIRSGIADKEGNTVFQNINDGNYFFKITNAGFEALLTKPFNFPAEGKVQSLVLKSASQTLQDVTVQSRKPFIQQVQGKTVVNVDAMISNSGTTVLELLEKSPGVLVDRNGGLSLQNKSGVLVMIDDKPTYLSGMDLNNLLSSMSSSQIDQIELITNPSSKYDAAGNAGIINIKTKKIRQKGFNGNFSVSAGHGKYYKNNNSLSLNYRNGRYNMFANYSNNNNKQYTEMYALRTYFKQNGGDSSKLEQPTMFGNSSTNHFLKTGLDYFLTTKTTLGIVLTGNITNRNGNNTATATWLSETGEIDSTINTRSKTPFDLKNGNVTLYAKHAFNKNHELSVDADWLNYDINNDQLFINESEFPQYYYDASRGELPASLKILSAKADYVWKMPNNTQFDAGFKTVNTKTDNEAIYSLSNGGPWQNDPGKTNHFLYNETISALYASMQQKFKRWSYQAGVRFENTTYTGTQLGHGVRRDSSFSNDYTSLFPSGFISFDADSNNALTLTVSRRLDRPPFQKLNPFSFIINKYTTEKGNPFTRPQFSWNFELSHLFKQKITTTLSYSFIKDYYSQIFFRDSNN